MSSRSIDARQTLSRFGEIAWFKLPAESNPVYGHPQVPYLGWRYKSPRDEIAQQIANTVESTPTQVEWTLDTTRRNWLLLPSRILVQAQGLESPAFTDAVHDINMNDREFCFKAWSDFELLMRHLQHLSADDR